MKPNTGATSVNALWRQATISKSTGEFMDASKIELEKWYYVTDGTTTRRGEVRREAVKVIEIIKNHAGETLCYRVTNGTKSFPVYGPERFVEEIPTTKT